MTETLQFVCVLLGAAATLGIALASRSAPYQAWLAAPLDIDDAWASRHASGR